MRTKLCRAFDCPRYVDDQRLFCSVHLNLLTPAVRSPISDNREAPAAAGRTVQRRVLAGTNDAVRFIARKEGQLAALTRAQRANSFAPGQGGAGGPVQGGSSGGTGGGTTEFDTPRLKELDR